MANNVSTSIPKGIYPKVSRSGKMTYEVRFMIDGARIHLGTHELLQVAIDKMEEWKFGDLRRRLGVPAISALEIDNQKSILAELVDPRAKEYEELLMDVDPSTLEWNKSTIINDITIPASFVTARLNALYGIAG